MASRRTSVLFDATQRLLRRNALNNIRRMLSRTHPADLALLLQRFDGDPRRKLFGLLSGQEVRALVIAEMQKEVAAELLQEIERKEAVEILQELDGDDAADILGTMDEEISSEFLALLKGEDSLEVEGLLQYPEDSAGGIMVPDFVGLPETAKVEEAIRHLRENRDVEMAFYVYVVNDHGQLVGVLSLRQLVISPPDRTLKDIMIPEVVSVRTHTDQEEVARLVARYNLLAIPVVDDRNVLLGLVTVDDVIDVLKEEATEDMLKMAGAGQEMIQMDSVGGSFKARFPWLAVAFVGEMIGVALIMPFGKDLQAHHYLAFFMPIIMAMGGNIGTQSATIVVRGLATGHLVPGEIHGVYWRELKVAGLLGLIYGVFVGVASLLLSGGNWQYGVAVALSMCLAMLIAVTVGALLPLFFARIKIDPAVSTGPFVTSAVDVLGLLVYFSVSSLVLTWM